MSSLKTLLGVSPSKQRVGEIVAKNFDGTYLVKVGDKTYNLKNALNKSLKAATQVVILDTDEGRFIVGEKQYRLKNIMEVIVDG